MPLLNQDHALEVCQALVDASPADETEVTLDCVEDRFVRFADVGPTQSADRERFRLAVRVRLAGEGGRLEARATCGSLDPEDGRRALERAMILARLSAPDPDVPGLGGAIEVPGTAPQRPTLDHTFREKAVWIGEALAACAKESLSPAGLVRSGAASTTLVNSAGRAVHGSTSQAAFSLTAFQTGELGGAGSAETFHANVDRLDVPGAIRRAVDKARRSRSPRDIPAGEYTVVLESPAVASLLLFPCYHGFGAQEFSEESSFLCGRVGQALFPKELRLVDDAMNEVNPGLPFDGEGAPKARTVLLEDGQLAGPVTDARWARKLRRDNTGHGVCQPSTEGPAVRNLVVGAGSAGIEQLVAGVENGLLISQLHYTNMIEPRDLTLTGMTRNGTFRIEGGRVTHPVKNLRFTDSLVGALRRVTGVGSRLEISGALFDGQVVCPPLRIESLRFTSTTSF